MTRDTLCKFGIRQKESTGGSKLRANLSILCQGQIWKRSGRASIGGRSNASRHLRTGSVASYRNRNNVSFENNIIEPIKNVFIKSNRPAKLLCSFGHQVPCSDTAYRDDGQLRATLLGRDHCKLGCLFARQRDHCLHDLKRATMDNRGHEQVLSNCSPCGLKCFLARRCPQDSMHALRNTPRRDK